MYKTTHTTNTIPHLWKHATIIPIPKPNKDHNIGTNYQPISFLSGIATTLLPYITETHLLSKNGQVNQQAIVNQST